MSGFYLGCAVWSFRGWVGSLYPHNSQPKDFLRLFSARFHAVEGNTTFYAIPPVEVLQKWRTQTPESFRFCLKIPREYSHQGQVLPYIDKMISFQQHCSDVLEQRLGPFFLQLPERYGPEYGPDLARVLNHWKRQASSDLLVELRHPQWFVAGEYQQRLWTMLEALQLGQVILDTRPVYEGPGAVMTSAVNKKPRLPVFMRSTADTILVRYISHPQEAVNVPYLQQWVSQVREWLQQDKTVYFFVHCPQEEHSPANARCFYRMLEEQQVKVSALPWNDLPAVPKQQGLFGS